MMRPEIELPDDVEALKAMVLAMAEKAARVEVLEKQVDDLEARNADADARIERLTQILKAFDRARFGRRSERLGSSVVEDGQHAFVFEEIETGIAAISGKSKLAEALPYSIKRRDVFERFLTDGRVELDSNIVERAIRPQAITRKIASSLAAMVAAGHGRRSRHGCRLQS